MQEDSWVHSYYEALSFFYWEPQHLGRKKYVDATYNTADKVMKHLGVMELTLNHQIKTFLSIAPCSLRNRLFQAALGRSIAGEFVMVGRDVDKLYALNNVTQPDFLFTSNETTVSLEMKIGAKSSVKQVLKYALLAFAVEQKDSKQRQHCLILLSKGPFSSLWPERFDNPEKLKHKLETEKEEFLAKQENKYRQQGSRYFEIVSSLSIGFMTYKQLSEVLLTAIQRTQECESAQVYRNLIQGMVDELIKRELV